MMMSRNSSRNHLDNQCQECGCHCDSCMNNNSIHLHQEIESLKERLKEREQQIVSMEGQIISHAKQFPKGEMQALRDNLYHWHDKYDRLLENYRRLQKVNQSLEDKLLRVADRFETERIGLNQNVDQLNIRLDEANASLSLMKQQNEQYRNDYDLAIRIIQSTPTTMINIGSFPEDFQSRYHKHLDEKQNKHDRMFNNENNMRINHRVPIPTFPPTAILYSLNDDEKSFGNDKEKLSMKSNEQTAAAIRLTQLLTKQQNICSNCKTNIDMNINQPDLIRPSKIISNDSFIMEMSGKNLSPSTTTMIMTSKSSSSLMNNDNNHTIII